MNPYSSYKVSQFIEDTKAILREEGPTQQGLASIGAKMQQLAVRGDLLVLGAELPPRNAVRERLLYLASDNSLLLQLGMFRRDQPTPETTEMHSHGTWGVLCGYQGREWYGLWERVDGGESRGYAQMRQLEYRVLGSGDITVMTGPPADVHTHTPIDEVFWIIALFGNRAAMDKRFYFTPQWRVREGVPGQYTRTPGARLRKVKALSDHP